MRFHTADKSLCGGWSMRVQRSIEHLSPYALNVTHRSPRSRRAAGSGRASRGGRRPSARSPSPKHRMTPRPLGSRGRRACVIIWRFRFWFEGMVVVDERAGPGIELRRHHTRALVTPRRNAPDPVLRARPVGRPPRRLLLQLLLCGQVVVGRGGGRGGIEPTVDALEPCLW